MMTYKERTVWQIPQKGDSGFREEFEALSRAWGPGLAAARIYEIHSDLGLEMTKIALRVAADAVRQGLSVAYHDVGKNLTYELEQEFIWGKVSEMEAGWGRFEVFFPTIFDHMVYTLHESYTRDERFDLIIIDAFTDLQTGFTDDDVVDPCEMDDLREQSLLHCRDWINKTRQSVLLLNHVAPTVDQIGILRSPESTLRLDGVCDVRTTLVQRCSNDHQDDGRPAMAASDLVAVNTMDHRTSARTESWPKPPDMMVQ